MLLHLHIFVFIIILLNFGYTLKPNEAERGSEHPFHYKSSYSSGPQHNYFRKAPKSDDNIQTSKHIIRENRAANYNLKIKKIYKQENNKQEEKRLDKNIVSNSLAMPKYDRNYSEWQKRYKKSVQGSSDKAHSGTFSYLEKPLQKSITRKRFLDNDPFSYQNVRHNSQVKGSIQPKFPHSYQQLKDVKTGESTTTSFIGPKPLSNQMSRQLNHHTHHTNSITKTNFIRPFSYHNAQKQYGMHGLKSWNLASHEAHDKSRIAETKNKTNVASLSSFLSRKIQRPKAESNIASNEQKLKTYTSIRGNRDEVGQNSSFPSIEKHTDVLPLNITPVNVELTRSLYNPIIFERIYENNSETMMKRNSGSNDYLPKFQFDGSEKPDRIVEGTVNQLVSTPKSIQSEIITTSPRETKESALPKDLKSTEVPIEDAEVYFFDLASSIPKKIFMSTTQYNPKKIIHRFPNSTKGGLVGFLSRGSFVQRQNKKTKITRNKLNADNGLPLDKTNIENSSMDFKKSDIDVFSSVDNMTNHVDILHSKRITSDATEAKKGIIYVQNGRYTQFNRNSTEKSSDQNRREDTTNTHNPEWNTSVFGSSNVQYLNRNSNNWPSRVSLNELQNESRNAVLQSPMFNKGYNHFRKENLQTNMIQPTNLRQSFQHDIKPKHSQKTTTNNILQGNRIVQGSIDKIHKKETEYDFFKVMDRSPKRRAPVSSFQKRQKVISKLQRIDQVLRHLLNYMIKRQSGRTISNTVNRAFHNQLPGSSVIQYQPQLNGYIKTIRPNRQYGDTKIRTNVIYPTKSPVLFVQRTKLYRSENSKPELIVQIKKIFR